MSGEEKRGSDGRTDEERAIETFKVKKLITQLNNARGNGTSMISLILPPKSQIPLAAKMLADEYGTASNIKSRVNRLSVLSAITSTQQRLKLYNRCPDNGLVIYCGEIMTDDNKIKKVAIDFEPFKPINTSLYLCDNKFHTEALSGLLEDDAKFGFIIMDGMGCLYGTVTGNTREVLHKFSVDLPKKHGRGGQSSVRFARLRVEKRHNYMRKTAEMAVNLFIPDGQVPFVKGIVLGGAAELKNELVTSGLLDQRLVSIIVKSVDTSYGGENGFNQAISLASDALANVKFTEERNLIQKFFDEITMDSGKYCFGLKDTMTALEMSAAETLIIYEDLDVQRYELKHPVTGTIKVLFLGKDQEKERSMFRDPDTDVELEIQDKVSLVDWFANNYKNFGAKLEFVTNKSQEGAQFLKGFGGIGGILRWKVDFMALADHDTIDNIKQLKENNARAKADIGDAFAGAGDDEEEEEDDDDNRPSNHYDDEVDFM
jgi:peptide chain release factor subunit 1